VRNCEGIGNGLSENALDNDGLWRKTPLQVEEPNGMCDCFGQ
jgi:hypothetical protein